MDLDFILVIPARYASTRLPGKPLVDIEGKPMIQRVYEQCLKAVAAERIFIATDDLRIHDVVYEFGGQAIMTSSKCLTGTDRVAEVAKQIKAEYYINVQGDEPLFNPEDILRCIQACIENPGEIINGYAPINSADEYQSASVPKVVFRNDKRLLYMSRAAIPGNKSGDFHFGFRQICTYGVPFVALTAFSAAQSRNTFENEEDIEILRFLEMGYEVRMVEMSTDSIPVDHPEDVVRVLKKLRG